MTREYTEEEEKEATEKMRAIYFNFTVFLEEKFAGSEEELMTISGVCLALMRGACGNDATTSARFFRGTEGFAAYLGEHMCTQSSESGENEN
jgi:hypothetical protein